MKQDHLTVRRRPRLGRGLAYLFAIFWIVMTTLPLLLAVLSSFKNNVEIYSKPWSIPEIWRVSNYLSAIYDAHGLRAIGNS